jgi:pimeloyl-ACP methyl ester carboxylesterase
MLSTLGAAGYRDQELGEAGAVNYGKRHYTCFQYDYDWRRDIVESAGRLHAFILDKRAYVQAEMEKRYGIRNYDVKFDIVAHSMGGLVARYYLRYGTADLPADGSLPPLTWAGARYIDNLVMIATPNAGSVDALRFLIEGKKFAPLVPSYDPAILGTMPSAYQLLPRPRHGAMVNANGHSKFEDIYDPELWERMGWGLADPTQEPVLQKLLPDAKDRATRRRIALDHQRKALRRARQFAAAMDIPASPPAGVSLFLVAGDAVSTEAVMAVEPDTGEIAVVKRAPGDGTVLRSSALMDERIGTTKRGRLESPIDWANVQFLFRNHLGLTKDPAFTDNLLYFLFERPKASPGQVSLWDGASERTDMIAGELTN